MDDAPPIDEPDDDWAQRMNAALNATGDGVIVSELPDLTNMTLQEIMTSNDPALRAAIRRVVDQLDRANEPGC